MDKTIYNELEMIPFFEIISPYIKEFTNFDELEISDSITNNMQNKLLEELSSYAEVTLQFELEDFLKNARCLTFSHV